MHNANYPLQYNRNYVHPSTISLHGATTHQNALAHLPLVVSADRQTTRSLFQKAKQPDLFLHKVKLVSISLN